MRNGFRLDVITPNGDTFTRKSLDKEPGEGKYVQQYIPFKFKFNETLKPNFGTVTLYNIKESQREGLNEGETVTIKAGWLPEREHSQLILDADIVDTKTYTSEDNTTYQTDIIFRDTPSKYHTGYVSDDWERGIEAKVVLKQLIEDKLEAEIAHWVVPSNKEYRRGKSFYTSVYNALRQVASDLSVKYFFYNKKAYVMPVPETVPSGATLNGDDIISGLLKRRGKRDEVTSFMDNRLKPGHDVKVADEGKFRIYSGYHTSEDGKKLHSFLRLE